MIKVKNKTNHCLRATKTQRILAGYGTHISVGDAALVLDFIDKLSKLAIIALLDRAGADQKNFPSGKIVKP